MAVVLFAVFLIRRFQTARPRCVKIMGGDDGGNVGASVAGSAVFGSLYGAAIEAWKAGPQVKGGVVAQSFKVNYAEVRALAHRLLISPPSHSSHLSFPSLCPQMFNGIGRTSLQFAMLGGLYSAGAVVSRGVRDKDDALNYGVGGMLAGAFLGERPSALRRTSPAHPLPLLYLFLTPFVSPPPCAGMRANSLHQVVLKGVTVGAAGCACAFLANRVRRAANSSTCLAILLHLTSFYFSPSPIFPLLIFIRPIPVPLPLALPLSLPAVLGEPSHGRQRPVQEVPVLGVPCRGRAQEKVIVPRTL